MDAEGAHLERVMTLEVNGNVEKYPYELDYPEGGKKGWCTVLGGCIGLLVAYGLMNTMGAIESYVAQHILVGTNPVSISMIFSVAVFIMLFGMMIGGILFDAYGYKELCIVGSVFTCGGMIATGSCTELYQFFLAFSVCCGIGCALLSTPLITAAGHFFNERRGLAFSLLMPGASLGGVIWPMVCRSLYVKVGFPWTMRILGFVFIAVLIVSYFLMNDRHEELQALRLLNEEEEEKLSAGETFIDKVKALVDVSVFKDVTFLWFSVSICLAEFSVILVTTYIPSYAISKGFSESTSLVALTVNNASGIVGRIVPTILSDYYGPFNMGSLMALITTLSIFVIWLPFGSNLAGLMTFCVVFGFSMSGILAVTPLCTAKISEPKDYGKRFGTVYFFVSFASLISLPIGMTLTKTNMGYNAMVLFSGCTTLIAEIAFLVCKYRVGKGWSFTTKV